MYEFHYDYIKNKYGNNSRLLLRDTDNLMYEFKTEGVHEDLHEVFDFSNYSTILTNINKYSKYYNDLNELVVGKMKNETGGVTIEEFVRLQPKMYSFLVDDNSKHKKAKDVNNYIAAAISDNE